MPQLGKKGPSFSRPAPIFRVKSLADLPAFALVEENGLGVPWEPFPYLRKPVFRH